jgi:hypothetical protein
VTILRFHGGARTGLLALLLALAPAAGPAIASATPSASGFSQATVAQLRAATAAYHSLAAAEAAGYAPFYVCTSNPAGGSAMGQHFVNGNNIGKWDPLKPQALVYRPGPNGYELVAVEYVVFAAGWDADHNSPPSLFGQSFGRINAPNVFGLPDFYQLHVWVWDPNPSGIFNPWNPRVSCPAS